MESIIHLDRFGHRSLGGYIKTIILKLLLQWQIYLHF